MKLQKLHIQNYKSLVDLEIIEPNPFTVFAGPNGSGKSNIFEAVAFWNALNKRKDDNASIGDVVETFGGLQFIRPKKTDARFFTIQSVDEFFDLSDRLDYDRLIKFRNLFRKGGKGHFNEAEQDSLGSSNSVETISRNQLSLFLGQFSLIFINNPKGSRFNIYSASKINENASNLENVLSRLFEDENTKEYITEWMQLFVPELEDIKIQASSLSGTKEIFFKEKSIDTFLPKALISDGTYNILCLLAAVYQTDEPQFLCIEEPENGLNPYVIESLVSFFRTQCEEKGHYIWLNTHSQTLVKELKPHELILVDKVNGQTKIKQFAKNYDLHGLEMDTAWLSNALGGGIPW